MLTATGAGGRAAPPTDPLPTVASTPHSIARAGSDLTVPRTVAFVVDQSTVPGVTRHTQ